MSEQIVGRRLPDTRFGELPLPLDDLRAGDVWRYLSHDGTPVSAQRLYDREDMSGNLTDEVWGYSLGELGIGTMSLHTVRSHDDGTVSIRPGDGSSNSVLHGDGRGRTWHGYVEHNVWTPC